MSIHNLKKSKNTLKISKVLHVLKNDSFLHQAQANRSRARLKGAGRNKQPA